MRSKERREMGAPTQQALDRNTRFPEWKRERLCLVPSDREP